MAADHCQQKSVTVRDFALMNLRYPLRQHLCGAIIVAVQGSYIAWRVRQAVLPFVRIYGQWMDERIIPLAAQLTQMADAVEREAYDQLMSQPAGEDYCGDGSEEAEYAFDVGLSFYEDISNMYQATLNLFAAGLFHVVEQQLADLTRDGAIESEVSETRLQAVVDWYRQHFQVDMTQFPSWSVIKELRLVATACFINRFSLTSATYV